MQSRSKAVLRALPKIVSREVRHRHFGIRCAHSQASCHRSHILYLARSSQPAERMTYVVRETDPDATEAFVEDVFELDYEATCGRRSSYTSIAVECRTPSGERVAAVEGDYWFGGLSIHRFVVALGWRTSGLGRFTMQHLLHSARGIGAHVAVVNTFDFQAPGFYKKLGFKLDSERPGWGDRTAFYYSTALDDSNSSALASHSITVAHPVTGEAVTVTATTLPMPLPHETFMDLNTYFRTGFDAYSLEKVGRTANFFRWAFEAVLEDGHGSDSTAASATAGGPAAGSPQADTMPAGDSSSPSTPRVGLIEGMSYWGGLVISHLCVQEEHRGKGVARALLEKALAMGKDKGCSLATVETMSFQCPSLYTKFGFTQDALVGGWDVPRPQGKDEQQGEPAKLHFFIKEL